MSAQAPYETQTEPEPAPPPPQKSSRGCLYGCLFVVVSCVGLALCAGIGGYIWLSKQVERFTSATPAELPVVEFDAEKLADLEKRVETFTEAFESDQTPPEDLVLTAEEINALISKNKEMRGRVFVKIQDGQVTGDVSIPVPEVLPGGKGRYFNGSGSFEVSMNGGILIVTMTDGEVNGERLPQEAIDALARENLAKGVYDNPDAAKTLRQIESVSVEGDKIILKIRRNEPKSEEAAPQTETSDENVTTPQETELQKVSKAKEQGDATEQGDAKEPDDATEQGDAKEPSEP